MADAGGGKEKNPCASCGSTDVGLVDWVCLECWGGDLLSAQVKEAYLKEHSEYLTKQRATPGHRLWVYPKPRKRSIARRLSTDRFY